MIQLLILGNGFDLRCNLKSSYEDFFENCIIDRSSPESLSLKENQASTFGFWEKLLFHRHTKYKSLEKKWFDIEKLIKNTISSINSDYYYRVLSDLESGKVPIYEYGSIVDPEEKHILNFCGDFIISEKKGDDNETKFLLNIRLLEELSILERRFCKYLSEKIDEEYVLKAIKLLFKLTDKDDNKIQGMDDVFTRSVYLELWRKNKIGIGNPQKFDDALVEEFEGLSSLYVLNFNYTNLFDILEVKNPCVYNNVHGKLCQVKCNKECRSNIIFGIDDFIVQSQQKDDTFRIFSKTYRKLHYTDSSEKNLPPNNSGFPISIKFYGHSLSEADYSYFQSIFDYYNLYDNNQVFLSFYYSKGFEQTDEIYRLIKTYGETLVNKEQGKNLIHKLLLENRIRIVEINE